METFGIDFTLDNSGSVITVAGFSSYPEAFNTAVEYQNCTVRDILRYLNAGFIGDDLMTVCDDIPHGFAVYSTDED